jgi:hypothetical protein
MMDRADWFVTAVCVAASVAMLFIKLPGAA